MVYFRVSDIAVISDNTVVIRVFKDGTLNWTPGGVYNTQCTTDVTYYPFDTQKCSVTLATWGYTSIEISLVGGGVDTTYYEPNGEWEFSTYSIQSSTRSFESNSLPQVSFDLTFKRRPMFQVMNTIIPMILLASLSVFVFQLPPDSGEKMGYSLTTLLAFAVYLTLVSANIPTTSINTPCLCKLLLNTCNYMFYSLPNFTPLFFADMMLNTIRSINQSLDCCMNSSIQIRNKILSML